MLRASFYGTQARHTVLGIPSSGIAGLLDVAHLHPSLPLFDDETALQWLSGLHRI